VHVHVHVHRLQVTGYRLQVTGAPRVHRTTYATYMRAQVPLLCSLNQLPKLDPSLFATWLNALSRAAATPGPPTRLWLLRFPATAIARLRAEAAAHASAVPAAAMIDLPTVAYEVRLV